MNDYLADISTRKTPQSEPIPGSDQVENSAGGFAFKVDDFVRLERFLILGSEGGSYYASQRDLTRENADAVLAAIKADGKRAVQTIVDINVGGRAPKTDPAIFALAMAAKLGDDETRAFALSKVNDVCRTGTHLFHFAQYIEQFGGWGRATKRAIGEWYNREDVGRVAYQAVKYRQRDGWTHADLLRLSHPKPQDNQHNVLFDWIVNRDDEDRPAIRNPQDFHAAELPIVEAFERAQAAPTPADTVKLLGEYPDLPREALNTEHLNDPLVWEALLHNNMPMTALIRNLATMTRIGVLTPTSASTRTVLDQLADGERLRAARVHPIAVLVAMLTYKSGRSMRGSSTWTPISQIVDALDAAFYDAFDNIEPTGKRHLLALDVSGSMGWGDVAGIPGFTPRLASAAMSMVTARSEQSYEVMAFATEFTPLTISPRQRLDDVVRTVGNLPFGGTDCALPMIYAMENEREVDAFVVYTDSETWAGRGHPVQALQEYRRQSGIQAKLIVVGLVANEVSIADPTDGGMLDVVGFDTSAPAVMADFTRG